MVLERPHPQARRRRLGLGAASAAPSNRPVAALVGESRPPTSRPPRCGRWTHSSASPSSSSEWWWMTRRSAVTPCGRPRAPGGRSRSHSREHAAQRLVEAQSRTAQGERPITKPSIVSTSPVPRRSGIVVASQDTPGISPPPELLVTMGEGTPRSTEPSHQAMLRTPDRPGAADERDLGVARAPRGASRRTGRRRSRRPGATAPAPRGPRARRPDRGAGCSCGRSSRRSPGRSPVSRARARTRSRASRTSPRSPGR